LTTHGTVAAPRAACPAAPVRIPLLHVREQLHASSRGICFDNREWFDHRGSLECLGAIPVPRRAGEPSWAAMSPGSDASACTLHDGGVACWGELYSAPSTPDLAVPIAFAPSPVFNELAVVDWNRASKFHDPCVINQECPFAPTVPLPPCARGIV